MQPSPKKLEKLERLALLTKPASKIRRIAKSDKRIHLVFGLPMLKKKPSEKQLAARRKRGDDLKKYSKFCKKVKKQVKGEAARRGKKLKPGHLAKICQTVWRDSEKDEKNIETR